MLSDPPDAGPDADYLVVGRDAIGPGTGTAYGYFPSLTTPRAMEPLRGPFIQGGSAPRDLYAASDTPLPESAWHAFQRPRFAEPVREKTDGRWSGPLRDVALRHGRVFALGESGVLSASDSVTLETVRNWRFERWPEGPPHGGLFVSETLVYATLTTGAGCLLKAMEVGRGETLISYQLPYRQPQVLLAGNEVLILGDAIDRRQPVHHLHLDDLCAHTRLPQLSTAELTLVGPEQESVPRPARLGNDWVFAAQDGRLYRWGPESGAPPQVLWPNPNHARLAQPTYVPLGADEVGLFADGGASSRSGPLLVRIRQADDATAQLGVEMQLPLLRDSRCRDLVAVNGSLFALHQGPGTAIHVHQFDLDNPVRDSRPVQPLTGTADATVCEFLTVPWNGQPYLMVHLQTGYQHDFVLVHPVTGVTQTLSQHPVWSDMVRVLWEAGRLWQVNLSDGTISMLR